MNSTSLHTLMVTSFSPSGSPHVTQKQTQDSYRMSDPICFTHLTSGTIELLQQHDIIFWWPSARLAGQTVAFRSPKPQLVHKISQKDEKCDSLTVFLHSGFIGTGVSFKMYDFSLGNSETSRNINPCNHLIFHWSQTIWQMFSTKFPRIPYMLELRPLAAINTSCTSCQRLFSLLCCSHAAPRSALFNGGLN